MVCVCSHLCAHVCRSHVCGGERLTSNVFLDHPQPPILRQGLWLDSAIRSSQLALGFPCLPLLSVRIKGEASCLPRIDVDVVDLISWVSLLCDKVSSTELCPQSLSFCSWWALTCHPCQYQFWRKRFGQTWPGCTQCCTQDILVCSLQPAQTSGGSWATLFAKCWASEVVLFVFRGLLSSLHLVSSLQSAPGPYREASLLPKPLFICSWQKEHTSALEKVSGRTHAPWWCLVNVRWVDSGHLWGVGPKPPSVLMLKNKKYEINKTAAPKFCKIAEVELK